MKSIMYFFGFVFLIASCSSGGFDMSEEKSASVSDMQMAESQTAYEEQDKSKASDESGVTDPGVPTPVSDVIAVKTPDKIIKTGSMTLMVEEYDTAIVNIKSIIKNSNAYISNEAEYKSAYCITNTIIVRITSDKFDILVESLDKAGYNVTAKTIGMEDVTAEFVDIQARLKTKKETEERYREILKQANTIRDILEVENYIKAVREEIESAEGRLKYLSDQVSYSTLTLTVQQESDNPYEPGFGSKSGNALSGGWEILKGIFIIFLYMWPLWLIGGITLLIIFRKKLKRRK